VLAATGASLQKGLLCLIGTTIGLTVGIAAIAWFSQKQYC
jgi:hypothetical protein